jgi:integrase
MLDLSSKHCTTDLLENVHHEQYTVWKRQVEKSRSVEVQQLFFKGIGVHHAGMLRVDRTMTEQLFECGLIKVLCCTATLAWGINLPAKNPVKLVMLDKVKDNRDRILSPDEYQKLLTAAEKSNLNILKDMIIFAYQTAMRFSEILKLQREDVKFDQRIITLRDTKNNEDRTIPISTVAIEILKKYPFGRTFLIVQRDKLRHYFEQACKRAGIKEFRFHDLRACSITNLFLSGMTVPEVAVISGQKT